MLRICLRCNKEFKSKHIGNRICCDCNLRNEKESKITSEMTGRQTRKGISIWTKC